MHAPRISSAAILPACALVSGICALPPLHPPQWLQWAAIVVWAAMACVYRRDAAFFMDMTNRVSTALAQAETDLVQTEKTLADTMLRVAYLHDEDY